MSSGYFAGIIFKPKLVWKYFYFLFYGFMILFGLFILTDLILHSSKYNGKFFLYFFVIFTLTVGIFGIINTRANYRIIKIVSELLNFKKKEVCERLLEKYGTSVWSDNKNICICYCKRKWWNPDYKIIISYDRDAFFVYVQTLSRDFGAGIDLGQAQKIRKNVVADLKGFLTIN